MIESIQYTPDGFFYYCSAVDLYSKLVSYNFFPQGLIEEGIIKNCVSYLNSEPYSAGPIFPLFLLFGIIFNLGFLFNAIHLFLLGPIYIYLSYQIVSKINKGQKKLILISIIFSPILIWLLIFPSTDIISSILILIAMSCILKVYKIFNKNLTYEGYYRSLKKTNLIFIFSMFIALLCRPLILIIIPFLIFYFLILWALNLNSKKRPLDNINLINFFYSKYFVYLLFFLMFFFFSSSNIYSNYSPNHFPNNEFKMHGLLFDTYSPPAPEGLKEITHGSFSQLVSLFMKSIQNLRFEFLPIFKQLIVLILSIFQSLIFSLISLAGLQTTIFSEENLNILRYGFSTYKIIFGLFINLPGIFMIFVLGLKSLKILLKEPIKLLIDKENIFNILSTIAMFYCVGLLISIGHIRYLLPILPIIIIGSKQFWLKFISIKEIQKL